MLKPVIILGDGGHAKVIVDLLQQLQRPILGVTSVRRQVGEQWLGLDVLGHDEKVLEHSADSIELVNGIGAMPKQTRRQECFEFFKEKRYSFATLVHPSAVIAQQVQLAEGVQVMAGAVIQTASEIGENSIINTRASVDHDCQIGRHCHVAPGVTLSGQVIVGDHVHIGTGASVIQSICIGEHALIAAGAIVYRSVDANKQYMTSIVTKEQDYV